jgi:4-hydroxy-tetrahydrodipicolinate synthase
MTSKFGLSAALSTPFTADGAIDIPRLVAHAQRCMKEGCDTITLFGTTGEGFSIGPKERVAVYEAMKQAGFDLRRHVGSGVMAATVEEAATQTDLAYAHGCRHVLLAPPFYFKNISDNGNIGWHRQLFEALGGKLRDIILYHLPGQTAVDITLPVVDALRREFPKAIVGIKDSSAHWPTTEAFLAKHRDIAVLVGDERNLGRAVREGGQGSICGVANIAADLLRPMVHEGRDEPRINALVETIVEFPVLPGIKALIAEKTNDPGWLHMRPPLDAMSAADSKRMAAACREAVDKAKV